MLKLLARGIIKARFAPHSEDGAKNNFFARQLWLATGLAANLFTTQKQTKRKTKVLIQEHLWRVISIRQVYLLI